MGREKIDRDAKTALLLAAAEHVFMRFGYNRTTMGLLADAANMSRPAVYLLFPGKDEIFAALVVELNRRQIERLGERVAPLATLHEKLLTACLAWNESVFDVHTAHPESRDMDDLGFQAVRTLYDDLSSFFATLLKEAGRSAEAAREIPAGLPQAGAPRRQVSAAARLRSRRGVAGLPLPTAAT